MNYSTILHPFDMKRALSGDLELNGHYIIDCLADEMDLARAMLKKYDQQIIHGTVWFTPFFNTLEQYGAARILERITKGLQLLGTGTFYFKIDHITKSYMAYLGRNMNQTQVYPIIINPSVGGRRILKRTFRCEPVRFLTDAKLLSPPRNEKRLVVMLSSEQWALDTIDALMQLPVNVELVFYNARTKYLYGKALSSKSHPSPIEEGDVYITLQDRLTVWSHPNETGDIIEKIGKHEVVTAEEYDSRNWLLPEIGFLPKTVNGRPSLEKKRG